MSSVYSGREARRRFRVVGYRDKVIRVVDLSSRRTSTPTDFDAQTPTPEEADSLLSVLDRCNNAASHVLDGMETNLRLLRECRIEAQAAHRIMAASNAAARRAAATDSREVSV